MLRVGFYKDYLSNPYNKNRYPSSLHFTNEEAEAQKGTTLAADPYLLRECWWGTWEGGEGQDGEEGGSWQRLRFRQSPSPNLILLLQKVLEHELNLGIFP